MFPENSGWCGLVWTSLELKDQNPQSSRRPRKDNIILSVSDKQQSVILFRGLMSLCTCPREWTNSRPHVISSMIFHTWDIRVSGSTFLAKFGSFCSISEVQRC